MFWKRISVLPFAIASSALLTLVYGTEFPGGAVRFLVGFFVLLFLVRIVKAAAQALCMRSNDTWAYRPTRPDMPSNAPGFPSSHAASMAFASVFLTCASLKQSRQRGILVGLVFTVLSILVGWSRIELQCHTLTQVIAGFLSGLLFAGLLPHCRK